MTDKKPVENKPKCFVMMPIADINSYDPGHFGRVYEHLLKPAIVAAGYQPIRADDTIKTDYIVVSIIQMIVESDIVICDLSARNPNVMYELGIRHAFNKPVVLIKDKRTEKIFDIQGLRYSEYDESLRIDSVQKDLTKITNAIKDTASADNTAINSIVQLAGINTAELPEKQTISNDTHIILSAINSIENRINELENRNNKSSGKYFYIANNTVYFSEHDFAVVGDTVWDVINNVEGTLFDLNPSQNKIKIKTKDGKVRIFDSNLDESKGLSSMPF